MVSHGLDAAALRAALVGRRFGAGLTVVADTGSTNGDLKAAAAAGAPDGSVLIAEHQHAGRGRTGRVWESPPGRGILLSALMTPGPAPPSSALVSLAAGLAAAQAIEAVVPSLRITLKWPNDVMLGSGKVAGILVEGELRGREIVHAVIGIGLNVNHTASELPDGATSAALAAGRPVDRSHLVVALLVALEERLAELAEHETLRAAYRARCSTLGQEVRVERRQGSVAGTALDIDDIGALVVATDYGLQTVPGGDLVYLRTARGERA